MDRSRRGASSTSRRRPSRSSPRSARASSTSASTGEGLGAAEVRALARRHGVRPTRTLGQHFLIDPNLARAIAADAELGPDDHVLEIGAGLGSLTLALAAPGREVVAVEVDRRVVPALRETVAGAPNVRVLHADATTLDWGAITAEGEWVVIGNLPYQVGTSIVVDVLERAPRVHRLLVMVQRELAERLLAVPGGPGHGALSVRVAARARGAVVRRVPPDVFWPRPSVESAVLRLERRPFPREVDPAVFGRVVEASFRSRRKTMRNALRSLGLDPEASVRVLRSLGIEPDRRGEAVSTDAFLSLAARLSEPTSR